MAAVMPAAFRRLCVETPSGWLKTSSSCPAAFRRLCVETAAISDAAGKVGDPAAFRRLCVETLNPALVVTTALPAAFRRLCVETPPPSPLPLPPAPAAFRRLCVETAGGWAACRGVAQPPSGGCVLKPSHLSGQDTRILQPPSGGCVLKRCIWNWGRRMTTSRLQAAVC